MTSTSQCVERAVEKTNNIGINEGGGGGGGGHIMHLAEAESGAVAAAGCTMVRPLSPPPPPQQLRDCVTGLQPGPGPSQSPPVERNQRWSEGNDWQLHKKRPGRRYWPGHTPRLQCSGDHQRDRHARGRDTCPKGDSTSAKGL